MGIHTFIGWSFWLFLILSIFAKVRHDHFRTFKLPKTNDERLDAYNNSWKENKKQWWDTFTLVFGFLSAYCFVIYLIYA